MSTTVPQSDQPSIQLQETNGRKQPAAPKPDSHKGRKGRKQRQAGRRKRNPTEDPTADWDAWSAHLQQRKSPASLATVFAKFKHAPLLWTAPDEVDEPTRELVECLHHASLAADAECGDGEGGDGECGEGGEGGGGEGGGRPDELAEIAESWLKDSDDGPLSAAAALETLAWCYALPALAATLGAATWWRMLDRLVATAIAGDRLEPAGEPLTHQLLAGELAFTLSALFPEIERCRKRASGAKQALSHGIQEVLDDGLTEVQHRALMRPLLACWTRCGLLARKLGVEVFTKPARGMYVDSIRQTMRLARFDGSQALVSGGSGARCKPLLKSALDLAGDRHTRALAELALGWKGDALKRPSLGRPSPADHSEWAKAAVLRSVWQRKRESLAIAYAGPDIEAELNCGPRTVWSGALDTRLIVDGTPLLPIDEWNHICWTSDDDVDYLELELKLSGGWKLQRQFALVREDRLLLLADALLGSESGERGKIEYRLALPLDAGVRFVPAEESNEGFLEADKRFGLVLPLALPEWRAQRWPGNLAVETGRLVYSLKAEGRALFAPLLFDLKPSRAKQPYTWRRLTVAQDLHVSPADAAVGYRVQLGKRQWLIYRTLAAAAPRTLLGQHLSTDFYFGRFGQDGEVDDLVEVETE